MREATAEHRRLDDAAPRLRDEIPRLLTLRLRFDDVRQEGRVVVASYRRPIVVESAPARFDIHCMEPRCDGRHDLTNMVLRGLRESKPLYEGRSECRGMVAGMPCDRVLGLVCEATYRS